MFQIRRFFIGLACQIFAVLHVWHVLQNGTVLGQDLEGVWDAELYVENAAEHSNGSGKGSTDGITLGSGINFGLELKKTGAESWAAFLVNGTERIEVPQVSVKENRIDLRIDHYDSELSLLFTPESESMPSQLIGIWKKRRAADQWVQMKLRAKPLAKAKPSISRSTKFDGKWRVQFQSSEDPAVGEFKMDPATGRIDGTFLTTTGDYRFLSGYCSDASPDSEEMWLSCFDGAHAFRFEAKSDGDDKLVGQFWSSNTWHETWTATRDPNAKLPDDFKQTTLVEGKSLESLNFPDLDGKLTNVADSKFAAPVRIVHIFGSWCPNCHDAGVYLAELKQKYGEKISIVGLAFELTGDFDRDVNQVKAYMKRNDVDHSVLIAGGSSDKAKASEAIPLVDRIRSYPTTIFADSSGKVISIHTGFTGPATGETYERLKQKFESTIERIAADAGR
jgi:thiol-disulfide isomerase/thioredoxin